MTNLGFRTSYDAFYVFFTNLVCKEQKEVWRSKQKEVCAQTLLCEFGPYCLTMPNLKCMALRVISICDIWCNIETQKQIVLQNDNEVPRKSKNL